MSEANIAIKATDQFSTKVNSMANASKGLSKAMEEAQCKAQQMSQRYDALIKNNAKMKTALDATSRELKEAKKQFDKTGSAADNEALEAAHEKYDKLKNSIADTTRELKDCSKAMRQLEEEGRRSGGGGGSSSGGGDLMSRLGKAGLAQAVGTWAANIGGSFVQSAYGDEGGTWFSNILSGAGSGAAIGTSISPGWGSAIGAVVGAIGGVATAATEIFEKREDYYRQAVQEAYDGIKQERQALVTSGSLVAAGREVDELAFNKLLGEGVGTAYLEDLRDMAAHTPLEYDQLTEISRQLAIGFGNESDRMLDLIEVVGDAGSAVGLDAGGMVTIATALSRMQSSDKVTLEYLNLIQERGIDAIGIIGQAKGMTTAQVYNAISKGSLDGSDIVTILQEGMAGKYGGSMQEQSQTYQGLSSTLSDQETERQNLTGENYTDNRSLGLQREIEFNDSELGQQVMAIDALHGTAVAFGENLEAGFKQQALTFLHTGEGLGKEWSSDAKYKMEKLRGDFLDAFAEWEAEEDPVEKAKLGERLSYLQDLARNLGENAYEMSDYYQDLGEMDKEFLQGIQDSEAEGAYWLGYDIGKELSKGIKAGALAIDTEAPGYEMPPGYTIDDNGMVVETDGSSAYGLNRVPYNGYIAQLHEGERVLTAQQARQMDAGVHAGGVVITGNSFTVREDADVTRIASELVRQIRSAQMVYAGG